MDKKSFRIIVMGFSVLLILVSAIGLVVSNDAKRSWTATLDPHKLIGTTVNDQDVKATMDVNRAEATQGAIHLRQTVQAYDTAWALTLAAPTSTPDPERHGN